MAPAELLVSGGNFCKEASTAALQSPDHLKPGHAESSGSPVTLPTDTTIDVKTCHSEEVHLENAALDLVMDKNCTGTDS